ncbi:hypothetical protein RWE15_11815 [Virgibacillus halophilus]|uniref:N-acetyltransferase domain-containing protein n=1 Tax=Tigheibacillus halophilus TaxID=361280 RepID=A0ABU5C6N3_9BACI|nr:hypothetical protein [Virgibacillus halophilus]
MKQTIADGRLRDGQVYTIRYITENDVPALLELQEKVSQSLAISAHLQPLSTAEFSYILSEHGMIAGVFLEEKLIGFRAMLIPEIDEEHLGLDCGISTEELPRVMYSEISCIDPEYRGNHLQTTMGRLLFRLVDRERFHYVCATAAPLNIPSIKDKLKLDMKIVGLKEKYDGKLRYILLKELTDSEQAETVKDQVLAEMADIPGQQKLLLDGYLGVSIIQKNSTWYVCYQK